MAITFHNFWQSPINLPLDVATTLVPYSASSSVSYSASSCLAQSNANHMLEASAGAKESLEEEEESLDMLGGQLEKCCTELKDAQQRAVFSWECLLRYQGTGRALDASSGKDTQQRAMLLVTSKVQGKLLLTESEGERLRESVGVVRAIAPAAADDRRSGRKRVRGEGLVTEAKELGG